MNRIFELTNVSVTAGQHEILRVPELTISSGEFFTIAGPNGAGKSTLLSVLSGSRARFTGACLFWGREINGWSRKEFSRRVAVVHQAHAVSFPFTVEQVVLMGRMPHSSGWFETKEDLEILNDAMSEAGAADLKGREFRTLSGGEQQRVILASALAQRPEVLLLDEPTNHLDLYHQVQFYELLAQLRDRGVLIIAVTHDLNLTASHCDRILLLKDGRPAACGRPVDVITPQVMRDVFRVSSEFWPDGNGKIWMRYGA